MPLHRVYRVDHYKVKYWLTIATTVESSKCVLAIKNLLFEKAGVPHFVTEVKQAGFKLGASRNTRLVNAV